MSNFSSAGRSEPANFADRILREVVMQHEPPFHFAFLQVVNELLVFLGAESGGDHRLRLAAREKCRAVDAREPTNFGSDWTNFGESSSIRTSSLVEDIVAKDR